MREFYVFCLRLTTEEMTIYVPGILFAAGISIYLFHEFNRVKKAKQDQRRESLNDKRQQYISKLIESKRKDRNAGEKPAGMERDEGDSEAKRH